jgi:Terminase RNaseH-like domain
MSVIKTENSWAIQIGWSDCPHLSKTDCDRMLQSFPPHEREARSLGVPILGAGKVYPVAEDDFVIDPLKLPTYWPRCYALDVGWKVTCAVWGAINHDDDILYIYSEYYGRNNPPSVHAHSIKLRGEELIGAVDPAAAGVSQVDGKSLINEYRKQGLRLFPANNRVTGTEGGIHAVYSRLTEGRLKIFRTCTNLIKEMRIYRRNEHGKIVKENDHAVDALRYLVMTGMSHAIKPKNGREEDEDNVVPIRGRNRNTGY